MSHGALISSGEVRRIKEKGPPGGPRTGEPHKQPTKQNLGGQIRIGGGGGGGTRPIVERSKHLNGSSSAAFFSAGFSAGFAGVFQPVAARGSFRNKRITGAGRESKALSETAGE